MNQSNQVDISVLKRMVTKNINPLSVENLTETVKILQTGQVSMQGQVIHGSNYTFLVSVIRENKTLQAIYKPIMGEQPLWDFPIHTLAQREIAAFIVSTLLKWHFVPPTVMNQSGPYGRGSLQLFIHHNPQIHYMNNNEISPEIIQKIALFDFIINNADRKAGHVLMDQNKKIWLIDHGVCFHAEKKLRTVIWEYADQQIPANLLKDIQIFVHTVKSNQHKLTQKFNHLLNQNEKRAMLRRAQFLLLKPFFPAPEQNRRSYPWPPI
ncbi:MAG: hypothetical protein CVU39_20355 [Chloroflexi bacterium HGW-Chloroflexi-10]|nr:MAG: hypothetical protein CVU39_20355 [Chloroflexi bacterium HGW-Chloroflexi-10]